MSEPNTSDNLRGFTTIAKEYLQLADRKKGGNVPALYRPCTIEDLLMKADKRMYQDKRRKQKS